MIKLDQRMQNQLQQGAFKDWFANHGDSTHRMHYDQDLNESSIVMDIGSYNGQYVKSLSNKYKCKKFYCFEPIKAYCDQSISMLNGEFGSVVKQNIEVLNIGIGAKTEALEIAIEDDASSIFKASTSAARKETIQIRSLKEVMTKLDLLDKKIDLLKINIEGAEFDLLEHMIEEDLCKNFKNIQVQYHLFMDNAYERREKINAVLSKTHHLTYEYFFVWENWRLNDD